MHALTLDVESRSELSIADASYLKYVRHPSTRLMCIATQFTDEPHATVYRASQGVTFRPGQPCPAHILRAIEEGCVVYAHNAQFDRRFYEHHCVRVLGWPPIPWDRWRCTMSVCSYYALPRKLDKVLEVLGLGSKDAEGHKAMMQMTKPKKRTKAFRQPYERMGITDPEQMPKMFEEKQSKYDMVCHYCGVDVEKQTELLLTLGDLPPERLRDWQLDQRVNDRGVPFDAEGLIRTQRILDAEFEAVNERVKELTMDPVLQVPHCLTINQRDKILAWLQGQGVHIMALSADDVEAALKLQMGPAAHELLTLRSLAGKASVKKVKTMIKHMDEDHRGRDAIVWHKASTGRFAGANWQPHNFPRDAMADWEAESFHACLQWSPDPVRAVVPSHLPRAAFIDELSRAMRSYIKAPPGKRLMISDFSSIEARVLAWLAGCDKLLTAFHKKECVYMQFASEIYGRPITTKGPQRQMGKVAVLGLGYSMGENKFIETAQEEALKSGENLKTMVMDWKFDWSSRSKVYQPVSRGWQIVNLYRTTYPEIPAFWRAINKAMMDAVREQTIIECGKLKFGCNGRWAWIQLPSGRPLWYRDPVIRKERVDYGDRVSEGTNVLSVMTIDSKTKKWVRRRMYGGLLCLAEGTEVLTHRGWKPIEKVLEGDLLYDGVQWVSHDGLVYQGERETIPVWSAWMTPDHEVLTQEGWENASSVQRHQRQQVRLPDSGAVRRVLRKEKSLGLPVHLWSADQESEFGNHPQERGFASFMRVPESRNSRPEEPYPWHDTTSSFRRVEVYAGPLPPAHPSGIPQLRWSGNNCVHEVGIVREILGRHGLNIQRGVVYRTGRQQQRVLPEELQMGDSGATGSQQAKQQRHSRQDGSRVVRHHRDREVYSLLQDCPRVAQRAVVRPTYDLLNAGPLRRFVVRGSDGQPFLSHNCENITQGTAADFLIEAMHRVEDHGDYPVILTVHDEVVSESEINKGSKEEFHHIMVQVPEWGYGCPIDAETHEATRYGK